MIKTIRRFFLKVAVTPERTRRIVGGTISAFLQWAIETKAWDAVSRLPKWLRSLADFIDRFNESELPEERDRLIAELVKYAITDEAVGRLIDTIAGFEAKAHPDGVKFLSRPDLIRMLKDAR